MFTEARVDFVQRDDVCVAQLLHDADLHEKHEAHGSNAG